MAGTTGAQGVTGPQGIQGPTGAIGPIGPQGIQGPSGETGSTGPQGIQGATGTIGSQGIQGVTGPVGPIGPQGLQGSTGSAGINGIDGVTGSQGPTGPQGNQGPTGPQGIQGIQGIQGLQGLIGPQGIQGVAGANGITGPIGPTGVVNFQVYGAYATRTYISSVYPNFTPITGLTITLSVSAPATLFLFTTGSLETTSYPYTVSGCMIQISQNGVPIPQSLQVVDVADYDPINYIATIAPFSITAFVMVPPGTYTFTVGACKYNFDDFYAGGNTTSPNQNEGCFLIQVFY